jgi:hypothetical protein
MLAVFEHLNPDNLIKLFKERRRVLSLDGMVILTTPATWSDRLFLCLARI